VREQYSKQIDTTELNLDHGTQIWRYLDPIRLIDLVSTSSLYCSRIDQFEDAFEGTIPESVIDIINWMYPYLPDSVPEEKQRESFDKRLNWVVMTNFVNSWCARESEDILLWNAYARGGFAIRSTVAALIDSIKTGPVGPGILLQLSNVKYLDMVKNSSEAVMHFVNSRGIDSALVAKHIAYKNENEIRLIAHHCPDTSPDLPTPGDVLRSQPCGISIPVEARRLIKSVFASPWTPGWIVQAIERVLHQYGVNCIVEESECAIR